MGTHVGFIGEIAAEIASACTRTHAFMWDRYRCTYISTEAACICGSLRFQPISNHAQACAHALSLLGGCMRMFADCDSLGQKVSEHADEAFDGEFVSARCATTRKCTIDSGGGVNPV
uniref:Uncharacterized protein n=1 Tax=Chrysotila carterae TaxID=13221 RepID=A0A7S4F041_CHRCT